MFLLEGLRKRGLHTSAFCDAVDFRLACFVDVCGLKGTALFAGGRFSISSCGEGVLVFVTTQIVFDGGVYRLDDPMMMLSAERHCIYIKYKTKLRQRYQTCDNFQPK